MSLNDNIVALTQWNDDHNVPEVVRILKLAEEVGEATQAYIGFRGLNPRKGFTNLGDHNTVAELCDVVTTALVALESLRPGAALSLVETRATFVRERVGY